MNLSGSGTIYVGSGIVCSGTVATTKHIIETSTFYYDVGVGCYTIFSCFTYIGSITSAINSFNSVLITFINVYSGAMDWRAWGSCYRNVVSQVSSAIYSSYACFMASEVVSWYLRSRVGMMPSKEVEYSRFPRAPS